jgi:RHS repeat-associated protein
MPLLLGELARALPCGECCGDCRYCDNIGIEGGQWIRKCYWRVEFNECNPPKFCVYVFTSCNLTSDFCGAEVSIGSPNPGYQVTQAGGSAGNLACVEPMPGSGIQAGVITIQASNGKENAECTVELVYVENCSSTASSSPSTFAAASSRNGSVAIGFALGRAAFGKQTAGTLQIRELTPTNMLSTPMCLKYLFQTNSDCEVITNLAGIRQVKVPEGLANVLTNGNTNLYFVEFYSSSQVGTKVDGLYQLSGLPLTTNRIENPDAGVSTNRLRITESDGSVADYEWKTNGWELVKGNGIQRQMKTVVMSDGNSVRTSTREIRDAATNLISCEIRKYAITNGWTNLTQQIMGEGAAATTNTFAYYTSGANTGQLERAAFADGRWEIYKYGSSRRKTNTLSGFLNQGPTNDINLCRAIEYGYGSNAVPGAAEAGDGGWNPARPRKVVEYLLGREIGRRYRIELMAKKESHDIRCVTPGAAWTNADNLVTITRYYTNGPNTNLLWSIERPDGTMDIHQYATGASQTNVVLSGAPDGYKTNIVDGVKTITVVGTVGQMISKTVIDIVSGITNSHDVYSDYDSYNRPRKVIYLDGTHTWTDHGCCGPITETNREGTAIFYYKDALKRQAAMKKNDITATNVFDAAGNLLQAARIGSDGSKITNAIHTYDTAGRMLTSKDALGNTTTYKEVIIDSQLVRTNIFPDGSTRIETYYRDGQLAKVTGTAVHPVRYEYGVVQDDSVWRQYTKEIKLDGNGNDTSEVLTNFFDMVGRDYKTVYADGAKRESFYNTKGQLVKSVDPDGVTMLYEYNFLGEVEYVVTDMDRDGIKDIAGPDRIRQRVKDVITKGADNVVRTRTYHWATNSSSTSNLVSVSEFKVDRSRLWSSRYGITNQIRTVYAGNGNVYETNTAADGSYSVTDIQHGEMKGITEKDASGAQLRQTTYAYDAHGRKKTETDARNGATTYTYDNADRIASMISSSPGGGQNPQTTTYSYDHAGRRTRTVMPDGAATTNEYHLSGELKKVYGARVYPVEYKYDVQGRRTNMTTWQNHAAGTGTANTSWRYDALRGFVTNKVYADGNGPRYTYTPAGRLQTRTWARGVTRTNEYDNAGDLTGIGYSDGTSNIVYNLDRLGRRTNIVDGAGSRYRTYTESGLLLMETNASGVLAGVTVTNGYDSFGRRIAIGMLTNASAAFVHTYAYDSASRLTNVSDGTYNASYSYLANSPLVSQITYRSNSATRMTTTKLYDYLNRLTEISSQPSATGESPISFSYASNDANERTRMTHADGSYWVYEYDKLGQVTSGKKYWEDGTPVAGQQFEYAYDDIGNRTLAKEGGDANGANLRSTTYSANLLNQYTNRTVSGTMDLIGIAKANATVTVNDQSTYRRGEYYQAAIANDNTSGILYPGFTNRAVLSGETNSFTGSLLIAKTPQSFWYDADGNTMSDGVWTNSWDGENRTLTTENTTAVPSDGRAKETWVFDDQGRWVKLVVSIWSGGGFTARRTNYLVWNGNVLLAILGESNLLNASFLRGVDETGSRHGASGVGGMISVNLRTNGSQFCSYDGNGNVMSLVNSHDGTKAGGYGYGPFGGVIQLTGSAGNENLIRFSTQFHDEVTDISKYLSRDYLTGLGRWGKRDTIEEEGGVNVYNFVNNSAVSHFDLFGRCPPLQVVDLGQRQPLPDGTEGQTRLASWLISTSIERCGFVCMFEVRVRACWARAEYWWSTPDSQLHELDHVSIWEDAWDNARGAAHSYDGLCVCREKAFCYQRVISLLSSAWKNQGNANNWNFDYVTGSGDPNQARRWRDYFQSIASRLFRDAQTMYDYCDKL